MASKNTVVRTRIVASDEMTTALERASKAASTFGNNTTNQLRKVSKQASLTSSILKSMVIARVVSSGISAVTRGVRSVVTELIDFDHALVSAGARFPEAAIKGSAAFEKLRLSARKVGAETEFTSAQAADGLKYLAYAGYSAETAMALLPETVNLATASGTDLARSVDIATDALGAFGLATGDSAQMANNLNRITNVMANASRMYNYDIEQMFNTLTYAGPSFKTAGQSIETFAALSGTLASAGIKASKGGTALRTLISNLAAPTGTGKAWLDRFQIKTSEKGKFRDVIDILEDLQAGISTLGEQQQIAATKDIFGKYAMAGSSVLLGTLVNKLREQRTELINNQEAAANMAEIIRGSLQNRLLRLRSALVDVGLSAFEKFEKPLMAAIHNAIEAVSKFDANKIVEALQTAGKYLNVMAKVLGWMVENRALVLSVWAAWEIGLLAVGGAAKKAGGHFGILAAGVVGWTETVGSIQREGGMRGLMDMLNDAMLGWSQLTLAGDTSGPFLMFEKMVGVIAFTSGFLKMQFENAWLAVKHASALALDAMIVGLNAVLEGLNRLTGKNWEIDRPKVGDYKPRTVSDVAAAAAREAQATTKLWAMVSKIGASEVLGNREASKPRKEITAEAMPKQSVSVDITNRFTGFPKEFTPFIETEMKKAKPGSYYEVRPVMDNWRDRTGKQ